MATQKTVVEIDIQGTERVESMRSQMRRLREELARLPEGSAEFQKVQRELGGLKDKMDDLGRSVNTLSGDPLERLNTSFSMIGSSLMSLDFGAAVQGLDGMASAVKDIKMDDIVGGIQSLGTAFVNLGKSLLTNPIFLVAATLTAVGLALYEYGQTMPFVTDETKKLAQATHDATAESEKALKAFDLEERKLRALGAAEQDIIKIRKQKTKETLKASVEELKAQQKQLEELQKSADASQKRIASTVMGGGMVTLMQTGIEKLGQAFGMVASDEQVADQTKNIDDLKNKIAEYEVQILELDKKEKDIVQQKQERQSAQAKKEEKQLIDRKKALEDFNKDQEAADAEFAEQTAKTAAENVDKSNADAVESYRKSLEDKSAYTDEYTKLQAQITLDNADKLAQELLDGEKAFQDAKYGIAANTIGGLMDLNSALVDSGLIEAKKGFEIAKTLGIAQTIMSTIEGAQNSFKTAAGSPIAKVFPAYPFIQAGIATAAGLAKVASIKAQKFNGGPSPSTSAGGGGGGGSMGGATPAPSVDLSFLNQGSNKAQPLQAYVLATNVSSAQEAEQKIKDQSKIIK
jgi:hypothetical protein